MKKIINMCVMVSLLLTLAGCATDAMKAPCDSQGHFCGRKTKINQW
jgi:Flp pilus assembly protein TadD